MRDGLVEAERICRHILVIDPGHAHTLHLLGLIEHQLRRSEVGIERIRKAILRNGRDPTFHHNLGNRDGSPQRRRATSGRSPPDHPETHNNLGPTWAMLPTVPDWRWLLGRHDRPYPTMRLFRQKKAGDRPNVARELAGGLAQIALWHKAPQPGTSVLPTQPCA